MGEIIRAESRFNRDSQNRYGDQATEKRLSRLIEKDRKKSPSRMSVRGIIQGVKNFMGVNSGSSESVSHLPYDPKRKF